MDNNREMMELLESIRQENIKTTAAAAKTARAMRICMILMAALIVFMAVCAFGVLPKVNATVNSLNSVAEQLAASDLTGLVEDADQTLSDVSSTVKSVQSSPSLTLSSRRILTHSPRPSPTCKALSRLLHRYSEEIKGFFISHMV